ncbi:TlpA family protein disulfide reductase [Mongoliitalea daihaiensis]|uniref:TlpA family protein disulfide reductase n=1 Tax=Mongoliitalea daihaiensis TaxID=2782006 RepID=UPI001F3DAE08|nr:TlpA disulfide reductase family protein [Mongoliitalea daihaiensis]
MLCIAVGLIALLLAYDYIFHPHPSRIKATHFQYSPTARLFDKNEYQAFRDSIYLLSEQLKVSDSLQRPVQVTFHMKYAVKSDSMTLQPFSYSIRIGSEYLVNGNQSEKIGTPAPIQDFITLTGEQIRIGGPQEKPTVVNLWFIGCKGCMQEMPGLNTLQEKFGERVNFVALTFDSEEQVKRFLTKHAFNFQQVTDAEAYIKEIGSFPYPENIFIDKTGIIVDVHGVFEPTSISEMGYMESIIKKML